MMCVMLKVYCVGRLNMLRSYLKQNHKELLTSDLFKTVKDLTTVKLVVSVM